MLLTLIAIGLLVFGVVDVITSDASEVRNLPKLAWLLLVVLLMPLGTLAWFFLGRPRHDSLEPSRPAGAWRQRSRSTVDPLDDPEQIMARIEARDRMLQEWAAEDRRRREGPEANPPTRPTTS